MGTLIHTYVTYVSYVVNKKTITLLFLVLCSFSLRSINPEKFQHPDDPAIRPWTFWYWMHGAVSKPALKADLLAMKEAGLAGFYLFPIRGPEGKNFPGAVNQLTPEWWEMVRYSMQIADSLGLQMGMHISDGFALAGGPWIKPEESMQKVVYADTIIRGGRIKNLKIRQPETIRDYYQDIAVFAFPVEKSVLKQNNPLITSDVKEHPLPFSEPGVDFRSESPCYILYSYEKPFTLKSLEIVPAGNNLQSQRMTLSVSDNGISFRKIKTMIPPRQGWQNTGFNNTFSIPPVTARYFKLGWTPEGTEPGSEDNDAGKWKPTLKIKAIRLSGFSRLNLWEGKAGLVWRIGEKSTQTDIPEQECIDPYKLINLTNQAKNGNLNVILPKGYWRILRMGHTSTGHTNATGGGGKGLECDKFSEKAVQKQFDNWFGAAFEKTDTALARKVLRYMHIDSWECGSQNWSSNFASAFKQRRGYDLMPWLPVMAGFPVQNAEISEKVLYDIRLTISELVNEVFFKVMVQNGHRYNCLVSAEAIAPTMVSDGMRHYGEVDLPMGEFWFRSPTHDKPNDMLDAISGAHIYGKNIIQSESFTQLRTYFDEHPGMLKQLLDRNFALGINRLFFHVMVHNPYIDKAPGTTLDGIGLYYQRDQTWWIHVGTFNDYIARCQWMLQQGVPVTDIAVFVGEEIPNRAFTPEKLTPWLPGIIGKERVEMEKQRLANAGQPMREMPAGVNNSANIFDIGKWINPLNGYAYDSFNKDVLMKNAKAANGIFSVNDATAYQVVIFPHPPEKYSKEVQKQIDKIQQACVYVPQLPVLDNNFTSKGIEPDVIVPENIGWTHRRTPETDIYFITNQSDESKQFAASFRIKNRIPQIWQAVDGSVQQVSDYQSTGNRTEIKLDLPPSGSVFVVFVSVENKSAEAVQTEKKNIINSEKKTRLQLDKNWKIYFPKTGQTMLSDTLRSWTEEENPHIRYYSGTAIYTNTFRMKEIPSAVTLDLGTVHNIAAVRINGKDCGTLWTPPFSTNIGHAVVKGLNTIEIELTNTWANAVLGADNGQAPFEGIWTDNRYRMKEKMLIPAGLLGPVNIDW